MKLVALVGTRPNFIKFAALHRAFQAHPEVDLQLVHSGQHRGAGMSDIFFKQLDLPAPHYFLDGDAAAGPQEFIEQVTKRFSKVLEQEAPDAALLFGDVNSTLAGAIAADQTGVRIAHVEAGLRSGDEAMPEEQNRRQTDRLSHWLFTTEEAANENLRKEGLGPERIHFVGNTMIDTLLAQLPAVRQLDLVEKMGLNKGGYVLATLHRNFNLNKPSALKKIKEVLEIVAKELPVVLPVHPSLERVLGAVKKDVRLYPPTAYREFLHLLSHAALVITDSGGVQEESSFLQVACLTYRPSTERPVTVTLGTNHLMYEPSAAEIAAYALTLARARREARPAPPLWDGRAAERIVSVLLN